MLFLLSRVAQIKGTPAVTRGGVLLISSAQISSYFHIDLMCPVNAHSKTHFVLYTKELSTSSLSSLQGSRARCGCRASFDLGIA